ncbi:MAG: tetratricopeptide repeat protein [Bacteroidales bacterium]|nr:tetratricopeptide repeat protein [Bacteroidales bacterium]
MKKRTILLFFASWCLVMPLYAQPTDSLWMQANNAYLQGDYQAAFDTYKSIYDRGLESASLCYNMGNCAFKMLQYADAILWFERARLLDPDNRDILHNIELTNRFILDKIEPLPKFFMRTWILKVRNTLSADQWAWSTLVLLAVVFLLLLFFFFGQSRSWRRWAFYGAMLAIILSISTFSFGWSQKRERERREYAIVFAPVATIKSAPDRQGKDLFIIHEGTKIRIMEQVGGWGRIELADGRQGWMELGQMERI